jgi:hypothetical protein
MLGMFATIQFRMKLRTVRWAGHLACMGAWRNVNKIFVRKMEKK